ncbi:hypothetical protein Pcinc_017926 [Petrolisthes cinctipes]|uniref:Uncharacterized protein n=1 Tax=Petrolisthes cinctipes TaxID=88211 RepID=A0AAE1KJZ3_PETCI|nr:hypothetical protein Pcinc_017926 [Petrolisthes cinctipes]
MDLRSGRRLPETAEEQPSTSNWTSVNVAEEVETANTPLAAEEEEEILEDYDDDDIFEDDYSEFSSDDDRAPADPIPNTASTLGMNSFGLSELSDEEEEERRDDIGIAESSDSDAADDEDCDEETKGYCTKEGIWKAIKGAGMAVFGFFKNIAIRVREKLSKKQMLALVAIVFAAIRASSTTPDTDNKSLHARLLRPVYLRNRDVDTVVDLRRGRAGSALNHLGRLFFYPVSHLLSDLEY